MAKLIDGKAISKDVRDALAAEARGLSERGATPGLAVVLVGDDPASKVYVRNKQKACAEVGIRSLEHILPVDTKEEELLSIIEGLNDDPSVHGILVQLPLPAGLNADRVIEAIRPDKDVDGFHPYNVGRLAIGRPAFEPCTPLGVMQMLDASKVALEGKDAVIVGRSNIVGKPMALMLLSRSATVTICHSKTRNLVERVRSADIVVAAIGRPRMVKGDWIKEGAVVIDVGINRGADGKLVGDVDFDEAEKRASLITPVPGGVGPMTIAMLLRNTVTSARRFAEKHGQATV
jgi:methylenetetrahydrofolate dehydrogenase (NADP+)/methenyltetrahydrofolate cyclohydrolase